MSVETPPLEVFARNAFLLDFTVTDGDADGAPLDLTGLTVKWALSAAPRGAPGWTTTRLVEKVSPAGGVTIVDATAGVLTVQVNGADTAALLGRYRHELEVFDGAGEAWVVAGGFITFRANIVNA